MAEVRRATRVAAEVHRELAELLRERVRDPRTKDVVLTGVEFSDDLRNAKVYFRLLSGNVEKARRQAEIGLTSAAGILRREVTRRLALRHAPEFRFYYDDVPDRQARIAELLREVEADHRVKDDEDG